MIKNIKKKHFKMAFQDIFEILYYIIYHFYLYLKTLKQIFAPLFTNIYNALILQGVFIRENYRVVIKYLIMFNFNLFSFRQSWFHLLKLKSEQNSK